MSEENDSAHLSEWQDYVETAYSTFAFYLRLYDRSKSTIT